MDKKWEIRQVSTSERIFDKIKEEMARPVGIVLFGADCEFKNEVREAFLARFGRGLVWDYYRSTTTARIETVFRIGDSFIIMLDSNESADHNVRHRLVQNLRNLGAKTVIGVYAKVKYPRKIPTSGLSLEARQRRLAQAKCINTLKHNPPTADGLDYFIVVEEEKEG